jgi:methyltransferase (TIGR00027 family)
MNNHDPSWTALATSLIRAHHTRAAAQPIFTDPWGDALVPDEYKLQFLRWYREDNKNSPLTSDAHALAAYIAQIPSYATVVLRARYTEDTLVNHLQSGVRQYVLVGAGLDSYALRRPAVPADLVVFEVDHPDTQFFKKEQVRLRTQAPAHHAQYIAADLSRETLKDALARSTFSRDTPAFFSWLGVSVYLPHDANLQMFRSFASIAAPGSALVFTYTDQALIDKPSLDPQFERMAKNAASMGEPFLSGFSPTKLPALLKSVGLELREDIDGTSLGERYSSPGSAPLHAPTYSHIVHAAVPGC